MKKTAMLLILVALFVWGATASAADIKVGGEFKSSFGWFAGDEIASETFLGERLRLSFSGNVNEFVSVAARLQYNYLVSGEGEDGGYAAEVENDSLEFDRLHVNLDFLSSQIVVGRQAIGSGGPFEELGLMSTITGDGAALTFGGEALAATGYFFPKDVGLDLDMGLNSYGGRLEYKGDPLAAALNWRSFQDAGDHAFTAEASVPLLGDRLTLYGEVGTWYGGSVKLFGVKFVPMEDLSALVEFDLDDQFSVTKVVKRWNDVEVFGMIRADTDPGYTEISGGVEVKF